MTIAGVLLGSTTTYLVTRISERARWRKDTGTRLNEHKVAVYAAYGKAVKAMFSVSTRLAAARGMNTTMLPLPTDRGIPELDRLAMEREIQWEHMLLLGDPAVIAAAREWHQTIWKLEWFARGMFDNPTPDEWQRSGDETGVARDRFYRAARSSLGITGGPPPAAGWPPLWLRAQLDQEPEAVGLPDVDGDPGGHRSANSNP